MRQTFSKSFKNCAVCNYWGGGRQVDTFGQQVTVDSLCAYDDETPTPLKLL
jgi:hypothetical protein